MTYQQQPYAGANQPGYGQQPSTMEPPIGQPYFGVGFGRAFKRFWRGYVIFKGRASRAEYWWAFLWLQIIMFILAFVYVIGAIVTMLVQFSDPTNLTSSAVNDPGFALWTSLSILGWAAPMFLFSLASMLPMYAMTWRRLQDAGFHGALALLGIIGLSIVPVIMCIFPTSQDAAKYGPGAVPAPEFPPGVYYEQPQQGYPQQGFGQQSTPHSGYGPPPQAGQ